MDEQSPVLVAELDLSPVDVATHALRPVCASTVWLDEVVTNRPYGSISALIAASESAFAVLSWSDILEAISVHGRIGAAADAPESIHAALLSGNAEYEARFGYVFMICAEGLSAEQMLSSLAERLGNDPSGEQAIVRNELGKVIDGRLRKAYR